MELALKAEDAVVVRISFILFLIIALFINNNYAEELPPENIEIDFNGYFDNFGVNVIYPSINISKHLSNYSSINAKYLIDIVTSASMRSHFDSVYSTTSVKNNLDAYTSATSRKYGGGDDYPDEMRHELVIGYTHFFDDITFSINNIFSLEHDYTSETITSNISIPFALKNTILNIAFVKRWDWIYPQNKFWKERKDVFEITLGLTQIVSSNIIAQAEAYYSYSNGLLIDPYQVVTIIDSNYNLMQYEPIYPTFRNRVAGSIRAKYLLNENSAINCGYRYYFDDWMIHSHTIELGYQQMFLDEKIVLGANIRTYFQTKAFFFEPEYRSLQEYIAVDSKLNAQESFSGELDFDANGSIIPLLYNEFLTFKSRLIFYFRKTNTPDWHSRNDKLYAWLFSIGFAYNF